MLICKLRIGDRALAQVIYTRANRWLRWLLTCRKLTSRELENEGLRAKGKNTENIAKSH